MLLLATENGLFGFDENELKITQKIYQKNEEKVTDVFSNGKEVFYLSVNKETFETSINSLSKRFLYKSELCKHGNFAYSPYKNKIYFSSSKQNQVYQISMGDNITEQVYISKENLENCGIYSGVVINSLCKHDSRLFASMYNPHDNEKGCIIELFDFRIIYVGLRDPRSIFFNSNNRLCFSGGKDKQFYYGDKSKKFPMYISCACECVHDHYWVFGFDKFLHAFKIEAKTGKVVVNVLFEEFPYECYNVVRIIEEKR